MKCIKLLLKSFCNTRSSKATAIKALYLQLSKVKKGVQMIVKGFSNPKVEANAKRLILHIIYRSNYTHCM